MQRRSPFPIKSPNVPSDEAIPIVNNAQRNLVDHLKTELAPASMKREEALELLYRARSLHDSILSTLFPSVRQGDVHESKVQDFEAELRDVWPGKLGAFPAGVSVASRMKDALPFAGQRYPETLAEFAVALAHSPKV